MPGRVGSNISIVIVVDDEAALSKTRAKSSFMTLKHARIVNDQSGRWSSRSPKLGKRPRFFNSGSALSIWCCRTVPASRSFLSSWQRVSDWKHMQRQRTTLRHFVKQCVHVLIPSNYFCIVRDFATPDIDAGSQHVPSSSVSLHESSSLTLFNSSFKVQKTSGSFYQFFALSSCVQCDVVHTHPCCYF